MMLQKKYSKGAIKLMIAAENLFGVHGIDGVSSRQIITAAKQSNNSAIQHNFGNKMGLVQAVFDRRIPQLEQDRAKKLEELSNSCGELTANNLLKALYLSIIEALNPEEQKSYAQFLLRLMHWEVDNHPFYQSKVPQPAANEIMARLEQCYSHLPKPVFNLRLSLSTSLAMEYVAERNRLLQASVNPYENEIHLWQEMIAAVQAIFQLPFPVNY